MNLKAILERLANRIDELALRERALLFLVVLALIYLGAQTLLLGPAQQRRAQLLAQLTVQRQKVQTLNLQAQAVLAASGRTPQSREQLAALRSQLAQMNQHLSAWTHGLVSPRQMLGLVRGAAANSAGVTLRTLTNLPAVPALPPAASSATSQAGASPMLYRHGLKIVVTGRYPDLVRYVTRLERLPWKVFWGQLTLTVQHYPTSQLTLVLYTVSPHRGWIGG